MTHTTDIEVRARTSVRSYSFEVEQRAPEGSDAHVLRLAAVEARESGKLEDITTPWRAFFEVKNTEGTPNDATTDIIRLESAKLREKWVAFYQKSPKDERLDLENFDPTIEGVVNVVDSVVADWQAKRRHGRIGKAKMLFHKFCRTLKSHSWLIELLPDGNEYVSVFTGSVNAIIKASANHEKVAEGFAESLCSISEHIEQTHRDLKLFRTEGMLKLIAGLYERIFSFLSCVMDWILEKRYRRLLDSLGENLKERFDDELKKIARKAENIRTLAMQNSVAEVRVTRLVVEGLGRDVRSGMDDERRYRERIESEFSKAEEDRRRMRQLGDALVAFLNEDAMKWLADRSQRQSPATGLSRQFQALSAVSLSSCAGTGVHSYAQDELAINSRLLDNFFSRERIRLPIGSFGPTAIGSDAISCLGQWCQGLSGPILWLDGPVIELDDIENPLTNVAAKIIVLATEHQLPVISYFCEVPRITRSTEPREAEAAVSLLYALLRQMVELLPPRFESSVDLSEDRFLRLDGSLRTWNEALAILRDLLDLMRGTLFCVIDQFHWLDDRSTDLPLNQLLECLRDEKVRLLLTTSARSGCLLENLGPQETLHISDLRLRHNAFALDDEWFLH